MAIVDCRTILMLCRCRYGAVQSSRPDRARGHRHCSLENHRDVRSIFPYQSWHNDLDHRLEHPAGKEIAPSVTAVARWSPTSAAGANAISRGASLFSTINRHNQPNRPGPGCAEDALLLSSRVERGLRTRSLLRPDVLRQDARFIEKVRLQDQGGPHPVFPSMYYDFLFSFIYRQSHL